MGAIMEKGTILVVDDDKKVHQNINKMARKNGYATITVFDGKEAIEALSTTPEIICAIILDWEMPEMTGIEFLDVIKSERKWRDIPVIMNTEERDEEDVLTAIEAGIYYYLTKPPEEELFMQVLDVAVGTFKKHLESHFETLEKGKDIRVNIDEGKVTLQTIEEAEKIARWLGYYAAEPGNATVGFEELLINAVEHGNLGITYEKKSELMETGTWKKEIDARLRQPKYEEKYVRVHFHRNGEHLKVSIVDEGEGFNFNKYLKFDPARAFDLHGKGIIMSKNAYLDTVEYVAPGNEVIATVALRTHMRKRKKQKG